MILVDSSVWVEYFNGNDTRETAFLDDLLGSEPVAVGDLILTEVLQGFRDDDHYDIAKELLTDLTVFEMLGQEQALHAAQSYRALRKLGVTIRKPTDVIIGSFCIQARLPLLFADRDFEPLVEHLNLRSALV